MKNRKVKKSVVYVLYALAFVAVTGTIYVIEMVSSPTRLIDDTTYVNKVIINDSNPVLKSKDIIVRPYLASNISIGRNFYNYLGDEENQKNSLLYYQGTYLPNSGVDYKSEEIFDIISVIDGKVTKITENSLLGKIVEVTHENNLISIYQSLSEVSVKENDQVLQGQVIGKSGTANISSDLGNHLHFELILKGQNVNPEEYYDKKLGEL